MVNEEETYFFYPFLEGQLQFFQIPKFQLKILILQGNKINKLMVIVKARAHIPTYTISSPTRASIEALFTVAALACLEDQLAC